MGLSVSPTQVEEIWVNQGFPVLLESYARVPLMAAQFARVEQGTFEGLSATYPDWPYGHKESMVLGMEAPSIIEHGEEPPADTLVSGYAPQAKVLKFGRSITFTVEDFNRRHALDGIGDKMRAVARGWGESQINWQNQIIADHLQKGTLSAGASAGPKGQVIFANSYVGRVVATDGKIYDNKAWFATDHPQDDGASTTYSNITASSALTAANLQTHLQTVRFTNAKDGRGNQITVMPDRLIVPPSLEYTARVLLNSAQLPGSANNDINAVQGALQLVVNPYLSDDSDAWWIGSSTMGLKVVHTGVATPEVIPDPVTQTIRLQVTGYMMVMVDNWRGWYAANKATS